MNLLLDKLLIILGLSRDNFFEIVRFCCVGVVVAALYVSAYFPLFAIIGSELWASVIAFSFAVFIQYFLQTVFTFRRSVSDRNQIIKFVITVLIGLLLSSLITGIMWPRTGFADIYGLLIVILCLPVVNFVVFKIWVYSRK